MGLNAPADRAGLIFLNVATRGCGHQCSMSQPSTIAERLLAHARLCREIARASWTEEVAQRLERLAEDCIRAAGNAELEPRALDAFDGAATAPPLA